MTHNSINTLTVFFKKNYFIQITNIEAFHVRKLACACVLYGFHV